MNIVYLKEIDSTHKFLKEYLKDSNSQICFYTYNQTQGIGSRHNNWHGKEGNLFFSFAILKNHLPKDLQLQSASIYFSFLLKELLEKMGSNIWLKWPNDFYVNNKKIGGTITNLDGEFLLCGIGLNLLKVNDEFGFLDIEVDPKKLLKEYFISLEKQQTWKQVFSKFKVEFDKSKSCKTTINQEKISLQNAVLQDDGSIVCDGQKVYSLR